MPRFIARIVAILLIHCLLADLSFPSSMSQQNAFNNGHVSCSGYFVHQAIVGEMAAASFIPDSFRPKRHLELLQTIIWMLKEMTKRFAFVSGQDEKRSLDFTAWHPD